MNNSISEEMQEIKSKLLILQEKKTFNEEYTKLFIEIREGLTAIKNFNEIDAINDLFGTNSSLSRAVRGISLLNKGENKDYEFKDLQDMINNILSSVITSIKEYKFKEEKRKTIVDESREERPLFEFQRFGFTFKPTIYKLFYFLSGVVFALFLSTIIFYSIILPSILPSS